MPAHLTRPATTRKDPAMTLPRRPARAPSARRGRTPAWVPRQGWQRRRAGDLGRARRRGHQHPGGLAAARLGHGRDAPRTRPALPSESRHAAVPWSSPAGTQPGPPRQATKAVAAVTSQGGQVAVLAVVSDGWPEPADRDQPVPPARSRRPGRWSGSRSSPPCGWPTTRPRCRCHAGHGGPWPRSRPQPAGPSLIPDPIQET